MGWFHPRSASYSNSEMDGPSSLEPSAHKRENPFLHLQQTAGNRAVQRLLDPDVSTLGSPPKGSPGPALLREEKEPSTSGGEIEISRRADMRHQAIVVRRRVVVRQGALARATN